MTYTGYENHDLDEVIRQIEHEGASRVVLELISRVSDLQGELADMTAALGCAEADAEKETERLEKETERLDNELATAHERIEMLEELINAGENA